jgi:hypothetical protein
MRGPIVPDGAMPVAEMRVPRDAGRVDDVRRRRKQTGRVTYAKREGRS